MPQKPYPRARECVNEPEGAPEPKNACQQPDEVGWDRSRSAWLWRAQASVCLAEPLAGGIPAQTERARALC